MEVRRIKKDELYHYGVKGMKWHHHKYTTGNSKGVKRRGEGLGTGPVGNQSVYARGKKRNDSNVTVTNTNSTGNAYPLSGSYSTYDELEKEKRRTQYKEDALISRLENEARIKESKKLVYKLKLFGKSFKEVHTENINKGINAVKKFLKR